MAKHYDPHPAAVVLLLLGLLLVQCFCDGAQARADGIEAEWNVTTKQLAAQCLVAEAGLHDRAGLDKERAAIMHILVKRWVQLQGYRKTPLAKMIRNYCSVHHAKPNTAAAWVKRLRWGQSAHVAACPYCEEQWEVVQDFVEAFSRGEIQDPLPSAMHFGNDADHRARVKEGRIGKVKIRRLRPDFAALNIFYAVRQ